MNLLHLKYCGYLEGKTRQWLASIDWPEIPGVSAVKKIRPYSVSKYIMYSQLGQDGRLTLKSSKSRLIPIQNLPNVVIQMLIVPVVQLTSALHQEQIR